MSSVRNLLRHLFSYFVGRLAVLLAGLISLPIMTRLLSKEDYGLMSLVFLTITIVTSFCALGFPQATTRYFAEYSGRGREKLREFCSTMTYGSLASSTAAVLLVLLATLGLKYTQSFSAMAEHLQYAVLLIVLRVVTSVFMQIFRGNQQTLMYNTLYIANRYLTIGAIVLLILFVYHDVRAVFVGTIIIEAVILVTALVYLGRRQFVGLTRPNVGHLHRAIKFGAPLILADVMVTLVASSDRFAIQYFMGSEFVAIYSVAYDVSDYVAIMFASPLQLAILPIVYSLWADEGEAATRDFLEKAVNLSLVLVIAMIAGFTIVGPDLVTILASDKYVESGNLVPYVAFGVILGSIHFLLFTGLLVREKTAVITALNTGAAITNLVLNLVLIPRIGLIGAAYATIITYVALNVVTYLISGRYLRVRIDPLLIGKAIIVAAAMAFVVNSLDNVTGQRLLDIGVQILAGAFFYLGLLYLSDHRLRAIAADALGRLKLD